MKVSTTCFLTFSIEAPLTTTDSHPACHTLLPPHINPLSPPCIPLLCWNGRSDQRAAHMTGEQLMVTWLTWREMFGAGEQLQVNGIRQGAGLGACSSFQSNTASCCDSAAACEELPHITFSLDQIPRNEKHPTFTFFCCLHFLESLQ